jgi:glutamine phosphoribosylpyrophosphate amidotransferase
MCGLFAFYGKKIEPAMLAYAAEQAFRRGPEAIGFAYLGKQKIERKVFLELAPAIKTLWDIQVPVVIGHCRLATSGKRTIGDAQPIVQNGLILAHNGTVPNYRQLGLKLRTGCDSEAILKLSTSGNSTRQFEAAVNSALVKTQQTLRNYAVIISDGKQLVYSRRYHPLYRHKAPGGYYLCSFPLNKKSELVPENRLFCEELDAE